MRYRIHLNRYPNGLPFVTMSLATTLALMVEGDLPTLDELLHRPAWMTDAACRGRPENFHPQRGEDTRPAKAVCAGCLVRAECLAFVTEIEDRANPTGIWGGTSARQRKNIAGDVAA